MKQSKRYSPEVRQRAVRMVFDHQGEYASQWAAIGSIAGTFDCTPETLRHWMRQAERERVEALERENRELKRANEILRKACAHFAQAELDRRGK